MIKPLLDPALITRHLRAVAGSQLLVAAVLHLNVFEVMGNRPLSMEELQQEIGLKERPAMVLFPALCAMGLLKFNNARQLELTAISTFLTHECEENLLGYVGLQKDDTGVKKMVEWLLNDGPAEGETGMSYVKDDTATSPMDDPEAARYFTMALAGRARYLSPLVAGLITKHNGHLLDVAGGTGYYTYEWLLANPDAHATLFDTPQVLSVARELFNDFCLREKRGIKGLRERVTFLPGDMLKDALPKADVLLAASLFHDWPGDTCRMLTTKFADALNPGGSLWVHDAFLNDTLDGPLAVTDYSAMLFLGTKGRAYSRAEYREWMVASGLEPSSTEIATLMDYGLINAVKPM